jgi:DNA-binding Lrp family transcriptional regulator
MAVHKSIDRINLHLLRLLQKNGRITNVDLAKHVKISPPPCLRRLKSLEEEGIIVGYTANLNPSMFGFHVVVMTEVSLTSQNDRDLRQFEEKVQEWHLVRECYLVSGGSDFLLKVTTQTFEDYQNFLSEKLSKLPNVHKIKTHLVLRTTKMEPGIPLEEVRVSFRDDIRDDNVLALRDSEELEKITEDDLKEEKEAALFQAEEALKNDAQNISNGLKSDKIIELENFITLEKQEPMMESLNFAFAKSK